MDKDLLRKLYNYKVDILDNHNELMKIKMEKCLSMYEISNFLDNNIQISISESDIKNKDYLLDILRQKKDKARDTWLNQNSREEINGNLAINY